MSKLSFRARALDASKPLPVFRCEDLPDLHEYASINRAVPQMPTGMEKEEESEHHLQRAISAQQVYGEKRDNMVIPVPEAESNIAYYESLYPGEFKMPKQLTHIQPFSLDTEQPDYDLDSEDDAFLNKLKKKMEISPLQFEEMIDRLEKGSGQQMVTLQEAKLLLKEDDELIREVFEYWARKRKSCKGASLIPTVKQEKRDGSSTSDPYVAFRRRTEKMQTRKNRKNDEASYEKMLKLRRDLSRAVTILEMIKRREKSKRELLHLTLEIMEKRYSMADFGGEIMAEVLAQRALVKPLYTVPIIPLPSSHYRHQEHMELKDYKPKPEKTEAVRTKRKYEKKPKAAPLSASAPLQSGPSVFNAKDLNQYDFPSSDDEPFSQMLSGSSEAEEEGDPDGPFAFRRKAGCQYYASRLDQSGGWPWCGPSEGGLGDVRYRYCLTTLTVPRRCVGLARRRVGRGGRVLLDRAYSDSDSAFHGLDPETPASSPRSPADKFASTSETNTSDRNPSPDLSQILLNIKSCRWRHFRPRTLPLHDPESADTYSRRLHRGLGRVSSAHPGTQTSGTSSQNRSGAGSAPVAAFTAEQYQQHQEHLALMQKQQLEQIQLQQANNVSAAGSTQGLVSKTLDSVSAQFAASALVTTDQLMAFKAKEEVVLGIGVNGILQASGVYKGLHLTSTAPAALVPTSQSTATTAVGSTFLQPSNNAAAQTPGPRGAPAHHGSAANSTTQVLIGSNIRLSVPSAGGSVNSIATLNARHIPRTLTAVPPSALKLAATTNCQIPKVTASSSMDLVPRENHDQDKPALNSIADNTVAMEVT
ncbi:enhancer of polycomb homolog 1-like isoform X1 [Megalops cyprinoides]|uniref:enhancer of polycomb homolog 1-like isoform X1 n=2 Tax=Megalops cyprinoides TaxID=118141 RepID=UPI001864783B|nr:enhancer of polycomb homolog 1-like isoform X1 [Megalops cyprinoides]